MMKGRRIAIFLLPTVFKACLRQNNISLEIDKSLKDLCGKTVGVIGGISEIFVSHSQ